MSRVKQSKKEINLNLIVDFESANFKNTSVRNSALKLISKFQQTGDYKYLRWLASHELIYREEIFWDQLSRWKRLAFLGDHQAEKCLEAVERGFSKCIWPPKKRPGRPRKPIQIDKKKYLKIRKELDNCGLGNLFLQELKKLQKAKSKNRMMHQEYQQKLNNRRNCLTTFSKKKKIKLTQAEIKELIWATSSEIARYLSAKEEDTSIITIKRGLAEQEKEQMIQRATQIWAKRKNTP